MDEGSLIYVIEETNLNGWFRTRMDNGLIFFVFRKESILEWLRFQMENGSVIHAFLAKGSQEVVSTHGA